MCLCLCVFVCVFVCVYVCVYVCVCTCVCVCVCVCVCSCSWVVLISNGKYPYFASSVSCSLHLRTVRCYVAVSLLLISVWFVFHVECGGVWGGEETTQSCSFPFLPPYTHSTYAMYDLSDLFCLFDLCVSFYALSSDVFDAYISLYALVVRSGISVIIRYLVDMNDSCVLSFGLYYSTPPHVHIPKAMFLEWLIVSPVPLWCAAIYYHTRCSIHTLLFVHFSLKKRLNLLWRGCAWCGNRKLHVQDELKILTS